MTTDLKRAFEALSAKAVPYTRAWQYYEGNQPLIYSTERLEEAFRLLDARFTQNWCAVVVDTVLDRLNLKGWDTENAADNDALDNLWNQGHLQLDAYDAHLAALVTGEAYLIAWKDESSGTQLWYNDPRLCHIFYKAENPKLKDFAAKWWRDQSVYRLNLYYPDRIEHYIAKSKNTPTTAGAFRPDPDNESEANPYGVVPIFHLRANRRGTGSELQNIVTLQDAINKLLADMMVAGEFGAFRQRWIITNSDTSALKNAPSEIWTIPAGEDGSQGASVGQFEATSLGNYFNAITELVNSIAVITRTPKHYFYSSAGSGISGEALLAMEAPLVKKVTARQETYAVTWREVGAFLLQLETGRTVDQSALVPIWEPAGSVQPLTEAQARKASVEAGIPLETQLRREGWGADEIDELQADRQNEKDKNATLARQLLERARIEQEQRNPPAETVVNA